MKEYSRVNVRRWVKVRYRYEQKGVFGYADDYGDILSHVMNRRLGDELFETNRKMDNGQGGLVGCVCQLPVFAIVCGNNSRRAAVSVCAAAAATALPGKRVLPV